MKKLFAYGLALLLSVCGSVYAATADGFSVSSQTHNELSLAKMGLSNGIVFRGGQHDAGIGFGLPIDQLVTKAQLLLDIQSSSSLIGSNMSLQLMVNGQVIGNIPLSSVSQEKTAFQLNIPAMLVTSSNVLSFKLNSQENGELCYQNGQQVQQIHILPSSKVKLQLQQLAISDDLSYFPKPFWDAQEMLGRSINIVFSRQVTEQNVSAASMLASWFGSQASYRGVTFQALKGRLPNGNGIVFGRPGEQVGKLTLPSSEMASLSVVSNPLNPAYKLLLVVGRDDDAMRSAVYRLTQGDFAAQTATIKVKHQALPKSVPYDAPKWIATDAPVKLKNLIQPGQEMKVSGIWHEPINFAFRAAPDLFLWDGDTIPLDLGYRFPTEDWIDEDNSALNVTFNHQFLADLSVNRRGFLEGLWRKLGGDSRQEHSVIPIQPYMIYGDNQLSLYFNVKANADAPCSTLVHNNIKSQIDSQSTIDLSQTQHFSLLPNLSFFVGASFPFTRLADFSQTALLLPNDPSSAELQTLLTLAGRAGNATGTMIAGNRVFLGMPTNYQALENVDVLAVSALGNQTTNRALLRGSPFSIQDNTLHVRGMDKLQTVKNWIKGYWQLNSVEADRYFSSSQTWRAFVSFQSPWSNQRTVVMATATSDAELLKLDNDLKSSEINAGIRGDAAVITDSNGVKSFQVAPQFPTGQLPWYQMAIWYANQHSAVFALLTTLVSLLMGWAVYYRLVSRSRKRLEQ